MTGTDNRWAREHWQKVQLRNLLTHAVQRSQFRASALPPSRARHGSPPCPCCRAPACRINS